MRLAPEPDNPHDAHAVAVYPNSGNDPIGYVNKQKARVFGPV
ncbi:HIRAN domain-containing protein [Streptomyces mirabilis]